MGLGGLPIMAVLVESGASLFYWLTWLLTCYLWPWIALLWARKSTNPFLTERRNLTLDSLIAGLWVPLLHFNLLPSVMLVAITTADKISTGIRRLWLYSLAFVAAGILIGSLLTGFAFQPHSSSTVILATLPIMVLHTLLVSLGTSRLVRKVSRQNKKLAIASQTDFLTGLLNRREWQKLAMEKFNRNPREKSDNLTLVLMDVDKFKGVNDTHGHSAGDDVLKAIAQSITESLPENSIAGRLGGDEFAMILPLNPDNTLCLIQSILGSFAAMRVNNHRQPLCTISFGMAAHAKKFQSLRQWFDAADEKLYLHKNRKVLSTAQP